MRKRDNRRIWIARALLLCLVGGVLVGCSGSTVGQPGPFVSFRQPDYPIRLTDVILLEQGQAVAPVSVEGEDAAAMQLAREASIRQ